MMFAERYGWASVLIFVFTMSGLGCATSTSNTAKALGPYDVPSLSGGWAGDIVFPDGTSSVATWDLTPEGDYLTRSEGFSATGKAAVKDGNLVLTSTSTTGGTSTGQRTGMASVSQRPDGGLVLTGNGQSARGPFNFKMTRRTSAAKAIGPNDLPSLAGNWIGDIFVPSGTYVGIWDLTPEGSYTTRAGAFDATGKATVKDGSLVLTSTSTMGVVATAQRTGVATLYQRPDGGLVLAGNGYSDSGPFNFRITRWSTASNTPKAIGSSDLSSLAGSWVGDVVFPSGIASVGTWDLTPEGKYITRAGAFDAMGNATVRDGKLVLTSTSTMGVAATGERTGVAWLSQRPDGVLVLTGSGLSVNGPFSFSMTKR